MSNTASRDALSSLDRAAGTNAGLILHRYLKVPYGEKADHPPERVELFAAAGEALRNSASLYSLAFDRWEGDLERRRARKEFLTVDGRLIAGLGNSNVIETGITLHHTYGVPYIPGSSLKGLAAHYCNEVWGNANPEFSKEVPGDDDKKKVGLYFKTLFGTQDEAGFVIFHDALMDKGSIADGLQSDVMTPHHGDYYSSEGTKPPTDYDDPNPVTFLSVKGRFLIALSLYESHEEGESHGEKQPESVRGKWLGLAFDLLKEALEHWGAGGKTSSGYGRLLPQEALTSLAGEPTGQVKKGPRYETGAVVTVTRVEDPKGKGRACFEADDGCRGFLPPPLPEGVEIGATMTLEIAAPLETGYNYRLPGSGKPPKKKQGGGSQHGGRRR